MFQEQVWNSRNSPVAHVAFDKSIIYQFCVCVLPYLDVFSDSRLSAFDCGMCVIFFFTFIQTVLMWEQTHIWSTNPHKYKK